MKVPIALYAGYFDPFTLGHLNVVRRAERVFEKVVVAVAADSSKKGIFSAEERADMLREIFKNSTQIEVDKFEGLLVNYVRKRNIGVMIRGIRTVSDFEYEYQMALANKTLAEDIETVFMMTEGEYSYLSSTLIKEVARLGGDISRMVPPEVLRRVKQKYATQPKSS